MKTFNFFRTPPECGKVTHRKNDRSLQNGCFGFGVNDGSDLGVALIFNLVYCKDALRDTFFCYGGGQTVLNAGKKKVGRNPVDEETATKGLPGVKLKQKNVLASAGRAGTGLLRTIA